MKKTYISPVAYTFAIHTDSFIAASIEVEGQNANVELDDEEYNDQFHTRRNRDLWEDEEDVE